MRYSYNYKTVHPHITHIRTQRVCVCVIHSKVKQCTGLDPAQLSAHIHSKKAVPLQAWSGPEGSRKLRFPDFMTTAQGGDKVVSLTHQPHLRPGNSAVTHFSQRLRRPHRHSAIGRITSMKNSNDTHWNRTRDLPICSTAH